MRAGRWREQSAESLDAMRGDIAALRHDLQLVMSSWMRSEDTRAATEQTLASVNAMAATIDRLGAHHVALVEALEQVAQSQVDLARRIEVANHNQEALATAVVRLAQIVADVAPGALDAHDVPTILGGVVEPTVDLVAAERDELTAPADAAPLAPSAQSSVESPIPGN